MAGLECSRQGQRSALRSWLGGGDETPKFERTRVQRNAGEALRAAKLAGAVQVLLAKDNRVNQIVATRMLEKVGCSVTVANDGAEAVKLAARIPLDLIFMDCHMPIMDGFAATFAIRAMEEAEAGGKTRRIITAQTANAMEGDREICLEASMDDYMTRPFSTEKLVDVINRWVPAA